MLSPFDTHRAPHSLTLFNKWIQEEAVQQPRRNTPSTAEPSFYIWSIYPLLDETQNYSSPCKVTSSRHAVSLGRERAEKKTDSGEDEGG